MSTIIPTVRVRPLLSAMNAVEKATLKKLLPKLSVPEEPAGTRYPAALLAQIAVAAPTEQYSLAGVITETLLRNPPVGITPATLLEITHAVCPAFTADDKLLKSKTTEPYLEHLRETRKKMRIAARGSRLAATFAWKRKWALALSAAIPISEPIPRCLKSR